MQIGGWSNDQTMRKIYTHLSQADVTKHAEAFTSFFKEKTEDESTEEEPAEGAPAPDNPTSTA